MTLTSRKHVVEKPVGVIQTPAVSTSNGIYRKTMQCFTVLCLSVGVLGVLAFITERSYQVPDKKVLELTQAVAALESQIERRKRMYEIREYSQVGPLPLDKLPNWKDFFVGNDKFFPRPKVSDPWVDGRGKCSTTQVPTVSFETWTADGRAYDCNDLPWTHKIVNDLVALASDNKDMSPPDYPHCALDFFECFKRWPIEEQVVLVVGSISPWLEAILISRGAKSVITVDYQAITNEDPRIQTMTISEFKEAFIKEGPKVDSICSFSSIEHDGLGRYGDPLSPNGDIAAIEEMWEWLKPGGTLFLGIPVSGIGGVQGNVHRFYSKERISVLSKKWEELDIVQTKKPFQKTMWINVSQELGKAWKNQPIFVWRKPFEQTGKQTAGRQTAKASMLKKRP